MANLHHAHSYWQNAQADERYRTVEQLHSACAEVTANSVEKTVSARHLQFDAIGADLVIRGEKREIPGYLTHFATGQFCKTFGAPSEYIRSLPAPLAAACLNNGLVRGDLTDRTLLFRKGENLSVACETSDRYERLYHSDITSRILRPLAADNWKTPAGRYICGESWEATEEDILPGQINVKIGDKLGSSGLYANDHSMFAFMVAPDRVISDGKGGVLMRGLTIHNSEVGDACFSITFFLCQSICGNHLIWSPSGVHEIKVRHIGRNTLSRAFNQFGVELRKYQNLSAGTDELKIASAQKMVLGQTKIEVLDAVVKYSKTHSMPLLTRERATQGYELAEEHSDWYGSPRTVWGMVAGLTEYSQKAEQTDDRHEHDRTAAKLFSMVDGF